ncbi:hypothetical protein GCM10027589_28430 [Actinocorallia lasiicapitis]
MLADKTVIITGAGPGLGRTLARLMTAEGANVTVAAEGSADYQSA